ncbi:MAG TPA: tRNA 2-thiouridine(34) synthase MnmA, partial [Firmicutes bacterium]|nr:tRNA 2-thiouridine(34) synthase MnmA [Bacillota bacterium]
VDSSVTAALLLEQGYEVIGMTMQIWPREGEPSWEEGHRTCCSLSAVEDARRVADKLGIPFYVTNLRAVFQERIIDYFTAEYARGRTPNPCIACNHYIKFDALLERALALGARYLATGHYARVEYAPEKGRYLLRKGKDRHKDQSYVLYGLTQKQLSHTLLPLGELTKEETRRLAADLGLKVAAKPDSQEICFVPDNDYRSFLRERISDRIQPGPFLDTKGNVLGTHAGLPFYTIGQRRGLGLTAPEPLYVVDIDRERNAVIVGSREELYRQELIAEDLNFIAVPTLVEPLQVTAMIRYNAPEVRAEISPLPGDEVLVRFAEPVRAPTPGQSVVFYQEDLVVGGGIIKETR